MKNTILYLKQMIDYHKWELANSDYKAIKHSEGLISDEDYASIKSERQALRTKINELEAQLEEAKASNNTDAAANAEEPTAAATTAAKASSTSKK